MKKCAFIFIGYCCLYACKSDSKQSLPARAVADSTHNKTTIVDAKPVAMAAMDTTMLKKQLADYLPAGDTIFEIITGDLNNDKLADRILITKGTDKKNIVNDEYRGILDKNRRGIIVLLNKAANYEQLVANHRCFSSENEDGGVYFAPELSIEIENGKMKVNYGHGRYGYWTYTFRITATDMELIGYDAYSHNGPVTLKETSINFLTKKKQVKENTNEDAAEEGEEVFKESWHKVNVNTPILLSEIKGFDELEMWEY